MGMSDQQRAWLTKFVGETRETISDPFFLTLAAAVAAQECAYGRSAIKGPQGVGINEIGVKASGGHPAITLKTRETRSDGTVDPNKVPAAFRLFRDRREQAETLRYAMDQSCFYEAARVFYVLAFYLSYTTGNTSGTLDVIRLFNEIARSGLVGGVKPLRMADARDELTREAVDGNHKAAREAVRLWCVLTGGGEL